MEKREIVNQILNRIINADCFEVLKEFPNHSVDLLLTDPPYGMSYISARRKCSYGEIQNDNNLEWLDEWMQEIHRILKPDGMFYIFCSWHHIDTFKQHIEKYIPLKNVLIWNKNNFGSGDLFADYAPKYEMILFGNPSNKRLNGKRIPNVLNYNKTLNNLHPTQKPVDLISLLIEKSTNKNDLVLDCFSGSGSTAIACHQLKRNFICIEKDEKYYKISVERLKREKIKRALF